MGPQTIEATESLVRRLLQDQRPDWADLPLQRVVSAGTDNTLFRLGADKVVRLPRVDWAAGQAEKEALWLPRLAPHLPIATPRPLWLGAPALDYPWRWGIYGWLPGRGATRADLGSDVRAAGALAGFVVALRSIEPAAGPAWGAQNHYRGAPLRLLQRRVAGALETLGERIDRAAAEAVWRAALAAPPHAGPPAWVHGDLHAANLVTDAGALSGVIDFGLLGLGDPAADLMAAWLVFSAPARAVFLDLARADEAMRARGRGWALYACLIGLDGAWDAGAQVVSDSLSSLAETLAEA